MHKNVTQIVAGVSLLGLVGCQVSSGETPKNKLPGASIVNTDLISNSSDGSNWPSYGRTYNEGHFSPLTQIDTANISHLGLAWSVDLKVHQRADSQPLEAGGVLYTATGLSIVEAFDAQTGRQLWRYDPDVVAVAGDKLRPSWGIRGLALWKGKVIFATQDGRLIALNANDGRPVWSVLTLNKNDETTITGAPRVFNGKVVIGFAGAEREGTRGALNCFDADTGKFLWRFYTVPGNPANGFEIKAMAMAAKTWSGQWWKIGPGGTVWNAITYDPELDQIYIGTGNGGPWNKTVSNPKGGDALFSASIVALDAKTGKYVWHYQENPNEAWDYDATQDIELATLTIDGQRRKVILHAPKNGFFFVIDRITGKLISAAKIGKVNWATGYNLKTGRPNEIAGARYTKGPVLIWPGTYGTHNWQPMAYSPKLRLVFIPTIHQADAYGGGHLNADDWKPKKNDWNTAIADTKSVEVPVDEFSSSLQAWNPVTQQRVWTTPAPGIINGGVMATAGNLVFQGQIDGTFNAFDARSGKKLWSFPAGVSVLGAPISYAVNGKQYISVLAGPPSGSPAATLPEQSKFGWRYRGSPRRLLTFVLGGTAKLPPTPSPGPEKPLLSEKFRPDPKLAKIGAVSFNKNCMTCHGVGAVASGAAPDLRASPIVLDKSAFAAVVHGGALVQAGMPPFPEIGDDELTALRNYVRQQALASQQASAPKGP